MATRVTEILFQWRSGLRLFRRRSDDVPLTGEFRNASRSQNSILAPLERRALAWLVARMPRWVTADHLTALALLANLVTGVLYASARWWPPALALAGLGIALNWFGDSLDGTLARARAQERPRYGFYVDHMADAFGALFIVSGMILSGYLSAVVGLGVLVAFSLLSINAYLAAYTIGAFRLSIWKLSPTELRLLLILGNFVVLFKPTLRLPGGPYNLLDVGCVVAMVVMALMLISSVVRNTSLLYRAERL